MYLATFLFESSSVAFTRMTLFNIITGLAAMLTINILQSLNEFSLVATLKKAFLILPNYCFGQGLADLFENYQSISLIKQVCPPNLSISYCCREAEISK